MMKVLLFILFLMSQSAVLAVSSAHSAPVDSSSVVEVPVPANKKKKRRNGKVSNKTKRIIGWSMIGTAVLGNFVGLLLVQNNSIEFEVVIFWIVGVLLFIPGVILVILGRRRRK